MSNSVVRSRESGVRSLESNSGVKSQEVHKAAEEASEVKEEASQHVQQHKSCVKSGYWSQS